MTRKTLTGFSIALGLIATAACGNTSDVGGTSSGATAAGSSKQVAFENQICGQTAAAKPGFTETLSPLAGAAGTLSGAGSTFVTPIMSIWAKEYASTGKVQVAYQSIGSGGGVKQITAKTVDFGASDTPMKDDELAKAGKPILHIPLTLGAVVPAYNVKGLKAGLKFDGPTLGKMFTGEITKWNDPAIKSLNPGVNLPDENIAIAHRSDGSGTTAVWTDYLTKTSPAWVAKLGEGRSFGKEVAWPLGIGGKGNEGVSGVINQTEGGFGYIELAYALAQNLNYGQVKNKAGKFIQPCVATIAKGTVGVRPPADLRTGYTDGIDPDAYPITGTTFGLVYQDQTNKAKAAALRNFLSWVLTKGQDDAAQINYAPLGSDLQKAAYSQLSKMTLNGKPLS